MKIRDIVLFVIFILLLVLLFFVSQKHPLTADEFTKISEQENLKVLHVEKQFHSNKDIENAIIAENEDYWQIEFFTFKTKKAAKEFYKKEKESILQSKARSDLDYGHNRFSYSDYTALLSQSYAHVCFVDNTVLYVKAPLMYRSDIESMLKKYKY